MATYEFNCAEHGVLTVSVPMAEVTSTIPCPSCGEPARRRYTAPGLALGDAAARRLIEATTATAHEPAVVRSPTGAPVRRSGARPLADPRTARLPAP
ncbi:zinc ribbon domain-containing protein [Fodinibacter luteus]|uniref:Zinc ribbon domain-containing protein n=1 Tax=Fodinibacter luteus TaxID=552064 RepID=A0ABP8KIZ8_9MICO